MIDSRAFPIDGAVQGIQLVGDGLWVTHSYIGGDMVNRAGVTLIDTKTMQTRVLRLGDAVTGLTVAADDVWVTVSNATNGRIYRLDAASGEQRGVYDLPNPNVVSIAPVQVGNRLWFMGGFLATTQATNAILSNLGDLKDSPVLFALDPASGQWDPTGYPVPLFPTRLHRAGAVLIFSITPLPVLNSPSTLVEKGLFGFDTVTRALRRADLPETCTTLSAYAVVSDTVILATCEGDESVYQIDPMAMHVTTTYRDIGVGMKPPVLQDTYALVSFRDTQNGAVFDLQTETVMRRFVTGRLPGAAVMYAGEPWLYNAADGTLQPLGKIIDDHKGVEK